MRKCCLCVETTQTWPRSDVCCVLHTKYKAINLERATSTFRELLTPEASTSLALLSLLGLHGNAIDVLNVPPVRIQHLLQSHTAEGSNLSCHMNDLPWLRELVAVRGGRFGKPCRQEVRCICLRKNKFACRSSVFEGDVLAERHPIQQGIPSGLAIAWQTTALCPTLEL